MYDLTSTLHTVASCSATVIAIIGGFFANKLVSINVERREILSKLSNIEEEIKFSKDLIMSKKNDINQDDSLDFISENIIDFIERESLDKIFEKQKASINIEDLRPFWEEANDILVELLGEYAKGHIDLNEDMIPKSIIEKGCSEFKYKVCKMVSEYIDRELKKSERAKSPFNYLTSIDYIPLAVPSMYSTYWYTKTKERITELGSSIDWLKIQERQLKAQETSLKNPEGMKLGLAIFSVFSICGIIIPLFLAPFTTEDYTCFLTTKITILSLFSINIVAVFCYYIFLLKWKKRS